MGHLKDLLTAAAILTPSLALAHEGEHSGSYLSGFLHVLTEPDHLAVTLGLAAVIGTAVFVRRSLVKRRKLRGERSAPVRE